MPRSSGHFLFRIFRNIIPIEQYGMAAKTLLRKIRCEIVSIEFALSGSGK